MRVGKSWRGSRTRPPPAPMGWPGAPAPSARGGSAGARSRSSALACGARHAQERLPFRTHPLLGDEPRPARELPAAGEPGSRTPPPAACIAPSSGRPVGQAQSQGTAPCGLIVGKYVTVLVKYSAQRGSLVRRSVAFEGRSERDADGPLRTQTRFVVSERRVESSRCIASSGSRAAGSLPSATPDDRSQTFPSPIVVPAGHYPI